MLHERLHAVFVRMQVEHPIPTCLRPSFYQRVMSRRESLWLLLILLLQSVCPLRLAEESWSFSLRSFSTSPSTGRSFLGRLFLCLLLSLREIPSDLALSKVEGTRDSPPHHGLANFARWPDTGWTNTLPLGTGLKAVGTFGGGAGDVVIVVLFVLVVDVAGRRRRWHHGHS